MAMSAGIGLRKIVRHSTLPYNETWPQDSWERKAHLLAGNELCNRGRWQREDRDPGRLGGSGTPRTPIMTPGTMGRT